MINTGMLKKRQAALGYVKATIPVYIPVVVANNTGSKTQFFRVAVA
jgi:hypothetical protein